MRRYSPDDDSVGSEAEDSPHSSDSENEENFSFNNPKLDTIIKDNANITVIEVMALLVSIAVKENWTFVSFIRVTRAFNVIFGTKYLPENK